jgi:hypothetical protein
MFYKVKAPSGKNTKYEAEINYPYIIDTEEYLSNLLFTCEIHPSTDKIF